MASRTIFLTVLTFAVICQVFVLAVPEIDPKLLKKAQTPTGRLVRSSANIFITMKEGTGEVVQQFASQSTKSKGQALFEGLRRHAETTQESLLALLHSQSSSSLTNDRIKSYWITNQIYLRDADLSILDVLAEREDIERIDEEIIVQLDDPINLTPVEVEDNNVKVTDWNLNIINAPDVWAKGIDGSGIVVANIDTGVRGTHETLRGGYRNDGYGWFDPGTKTQVPTDDHGHGTLTLALTTGRLDIGVAPGSTWIACKGLNAQGQGLQSVLIECGQFLLCPTKIDGSDPDCSKAPRVINNSWNSQDAGATFYLPVLDAWQAAGIIPVFSNGNYGTACATVGSQASQNVIAVGATNSQDRLAYFSSVGPGYFEGQIKPDIVAPGEAVKSAFNSGDSAYAASSGTSLAAPEVAGLIALLLQVNPELKYDAVKQILEVTAERDRLGSSGVSCDGVRDSVFPNNHFGHGRVSAIAAYECVFGGNSCIGADYGEPCGTCKEGLACLDGRCRCRDVFGQIFDSELGQCLSLVGAGCSAGNSSCVDSAYCDNNRCRCDTDSGLVAAQNRGRCYQALKYGQECSANQCDFNKGLACAGDSGRCVCVDSLLEFRESDGTCVAASGSQCGNLPVEGSCLPPVGAASSGACEFYRVGCAGGANCKEGEAGGRVCQA